MSVRRNLLLDPSESRKRIDIISSPSPKKIHHLAGAPFRVEMKLDQEEATGLSSPRATPAAWSSPRRPRTSTIRSCKPMSLVLLRDHCSHESQLLPESLFGRSFETTVKEVKSFKSRGQDRPLISPKSDYHGYQDDYLIKEITTELCGKPNVTVLSFNGPTKQIRDAGFPNRSGNPQCGNTLPGSKQTSWNRPQTANESRDRLQVTKSSSPRNSKMQGFSTSPCVQINKIGIEFQDGARHSARGSIRTR
jgi:hypothetical protein